MSSFRTLGRRRAMSGLGFDCSRGSVARWPWRVASCKLCSRVRPSGSVLESKHAKRYRHTAAAAPPAAAARDGPPKTLLPPSPEQRVAIDALLHTSNNIVIDACAGSGKTTTILHLARAAPGKEFLVLVYNNRLMMETEDRVGDLGLDNVTVLTYHTLGSRCYTSECSTDQGLKRVVENDMAVLPGKELPDFSILVMDEQQDMTPILKLFVDKVIRDKGFTTSKTRRRPSEKKKKPLRIVVLGDKRQELYGFNNADSRFLTMASRPEVFGYVNDYGWISADQTTSIRVPQPLAEFINAQLIKGSGTAMRAARSQDNQGRPYPRPRYVICDPSQDVLGEVQRLLGLPDVLADDIIILAPSVRTAAVIDLGNDIALAGIPVFRSDSDVSDVAPRVARGKVLICTYHQAKGIERKASIVLGFDQGYHSWFNKMAETPTAVTNPQYVAATRALEHMVLIHDYANSPLPFVDLATVGQTCELVMHRPYSLEQPPSSDAEPPAPAASLSVQEPFRRFGVTALCRNLSEALITRCISQLDLEMLAEPAFGPNPPPPTEVPDRYGLIESVSNVTGTAVPAIFQWRQMKMLAIMSDLVKLLDPLKRRPTKIRPVRRLPESHYEKLRLIAASHGDGVLSTSDLLFLANMYMGLKSRDIIKLLAIPLDGYTWMPEAHSHDVHMTLNTLPGLAKIWGRGIQFERFKRREFPDITHGGGPTNPVKKAGVVVTGIMDICRPWRDGAIVWEIKYVNSLQPDHVLQVALYMLLLDEPCSGFLVSVRTGQTVQLRPKTPDSLVKILQLLVDAKSGGDQTRLLGSYTDDEFLDEARRDFSGLVGKCVLPMWFAMKPVGSKFEARRRRTMQNKVPDKTRSISLR